LRLQHGDTEPIRYRKHLSTDSPSIQGPWTPWTHANPENVAAVFPNENLSKVLHQEPSATDKLLELMKARQEQEKDAAKE